MPNKLPRNLKHPIKEGPNGGLHQHTRAGDRGLLDKPIKTGERGGHYQEYRSHGHVERRHLLK